MQELTPMPGRDLERELPDPDRYRTSDNMESSPDELYNTLLTPELFAERFGLPAAMIRLAVECGMESSDGKITAIAVFQWIYVHYNDLRERAGLPPLAAPIESITVEERECITIRNVLRTHADLLASPISLLKEKEEWMSGSIEFDLCARKSG